MRPPDRAEPDAIFLSQFGDGCTLAVGIKSLGASKLLALAPGTLDPRVGAAADQAALELSNAAHAGQHQPADIGRGVAPAFPKRQEAAGEASHCTGRG